MEMLRIDRFFLFSSYRSAFLGGNYLGSSEGHLDSLTLLDKGRIFCLQAALPQYRCSHHKISQPLKLKELSFSADLWPRPGLDPPKALSNPLCWWSRAHNTFEISELIRKCSLGKQICLLHVSSLEVGSPWWHTSAVSPASSSLFVSLFFLPFFPPPVSPKLSLSPRMTNKPIHHRLFFQAWKVSSDGHVPGGS